MSNNTIYERKNTMGHCLTVARTKDHPFFELLEEALIYECGNISLVGKWEKVYERAFHRGKMRRNT